MSRQIWSREMIIDEIARLHASGFDITQSRMEAIDSRLTSAAIRYFGSWRAAVEASGIDYEEVAAIGRRRRAEKITKWTRESILEEIRRLHAAGEDLTSTVVRRQHLSLYATARRRDHFGSWAAALEAAGIDYASLKASARERRRHEVDWKQQLLVDFYADASRPRVKALPISAETPSAAPDWARELVLERLIELYERGKGLGEKPMRRLQTLISRGRHPAPEGDNGEGE